jgi:uncharacterized membrane protein
MKNFIRFIKTTIIGGLFFIVPLILLVMVAEKAVAIIRKLFHPLIYQSPDKVIVGIAMDKLIWVFLLLLACFSAGLLAKTLIAKRLVTWIESSVLQYVPGYTFIKSIGKTATGFEEQDMKIVLVKVDDGWQFSFLIEQVNESLYTVFIPNSPDTWSGSVYHVRKDNIIWTDISQKHVIHCLRQMGFGSADLLKKQFKIPT